MIGLPCWQGLSALFAMSFVDVSMSLILLCRCNTSALAPDNEKNGNAQDRKAQN